MLNGDLGANYNGIQISSGIFHMWRAWGITNESELMALAIGAVVMAAPVSYTHLTLPTNREV